MFTKQFTSKLARDNFRKQKPYCQSEEEYKLRKKCAFSCVFVRLMLKVNTDWVRDLEKRIWCLFLVNFFMFFGYARRFLLTGCNKLNRWERGDEDIFIKCISFANMRHPVNHLICYFCFVLPFRNEFLFFCFAFSYLYFVVCISR